MDISNVKDFYIPSTISIVEMVGPSDLEEVYTTNSTIEETLINKIKKKICNRCNSQGFIGPDVHIINRSIGKLKPAHFNGSVYYNLNIRVQICIPLIGANIRCSVRGKNNAGVLCSAEPFQIMLCNDLDNLDPLEVGDSVVIEILNYKIVINKPDIKILGRLKKAM